MLRAKAHFKIDPMKTSTALSSSPLSQIGIFPFVLFFTTEWPVILYSGLRSAIYQHFKREKMCAERTNHNIRNIFARTLFIFIGAHFTASSNTFCISAVLAVMVENTLKKLFTFEYNMNNTLISCLKYLKWILLERFDCSEIRVIQANEISK